MNMKEKISIDEFDGKKFKIRFVEEDDNKKAVLTHYLHNYHNGVKKHFEDEANDYLNQIIEYKNQEENLNTFVPPISRQSFCWISDLAGY